MFSVPWSYPRLYNEKPTIIGSSSRVEAGSNTSTVDLRVVGADKKGSLESESRFHIAETAHFCISAERLWLLLHSLKTCTIFLPSHYLSHQHEQGRTQFS
jgi:hypothetical protein